MNTIIPKSMDVKRRSFLIIFMICSVLPAFSQVGVSINTDGSDPDASAMLDITSTDRGVLIPRMNTTQWNNIASPAEGLLVYVTDSSAFYYYDGASWGKIANQNQLGGSSDYAEFEHDGTLVFNGESTTWDDLQIPGYATRGWFGAAPSVAQYGSDNLYLLSFDGDSDDDQVYFTVQLPHRYKEGSTIYPHIHFVSESTTANTVRWGLEYTWASVNESFGASTTVYADQAGLTADLHEVLGFGGIAPAADQEKISSMIICRLFRNSSSATDDYAGDVLFLQFDVHYEVNTTGSRLQWIK